MCPGPLVAHKAHSRSLFSVHKLREGANAAEPCRCLDGAGRLAGREELYRSGRPDLYKPNGPRNVVIHRSGLYGRDGIGTISPI